MSEEDKKKALEATVAEEWKKFEDRIFGGKNVSPFQRRDMKASFYAGALSLLCMSHELGIDEISEDEGAVALQGWKDEVNAHFIGFKE